MIVSLPSGNPQDWGDPILIDISEIVAPEGVAWYNVAVKATIGADVIYNQSISADLSGNIQVDLTALVYLPCSIVVEFTERYMIGTELTETPLPEFTENIEVVNPIVMDSEIEGGISKNWGDPIIVNITGAKLPVDSVDYWAILIVSKMDGETVEEVIYETWEESNETGELTLDISDQIRSEGVFRIEFGQTYIPYIGSSPGDRITEMFSAITKTVTVVNTVTVETDNYTIPGGAVQLSGNPIQIIVPTESADMVGKNNYKRALKVTCSELIGSPMVEEIAPDDDLNSIFHISGLVDQPVVYDFKFPAVGVITDHRALEYNVSLDVGEIYLDGSGNRQANWTGLAPETNSMRVLKGKLKPYELAKLAEIGRNFNSEYIENGKFLTHLPDKIKVAPGQIVKLWLLSKYPDIHNASWRCNVYYNPYGYYLDYETPVGVYSQLLAGDLVLDPASGLLEFNIEPAFMGFWNYHSPGSKLLAFKFWLEDSEGDITERRTFVIDDNYYEQSFFFYYVNPLSGIDSIWMHGEHSEHLKTEKETAYRPVPVGSGTKVGSLKTTFASGQRTWELNTGYKINSKEILGLRDFLESSEYWMIDPDLPIRLIPVIVEAGSFVLNDSAADYIPNLGIKIQEAHV